MSGQFRAVWLTLIAVTLVAPVAAMGQTSSSKARAGTYDQPRTPWGDPDMQGTWNNVTATPLETPKELGGKAILSNEEAADYEGQIKDRQAKAEARPHTGYAASVWFESSQSLSQNRTSLLVEPASGHLPALTADAQKIADELAARRKASPADTPEDRGPYERCITRGLPGSMMPGFYNHNYQILQTPGYVAIIVEMIHDARIIPVDGRPHVDAGIKQWLGDSRGRWEGNTLVVETTGLRGVNLRNAAVFGTSDKGRVVERFTRTSADTMDYRFTIEDPSTFTQSWTASIPMTKVEGPLYEYACHEGNYGLPNILSGHRKEEADATLKK